MFSDFSEPALAGFIFLEQPRSELSGYNEAINGPKKSEASGLTRDLQ
jgi:hypothetical protein